MDPQQQGAHAGSGPALDPNPAAPTPPASPATAQSGVIQLTAAELQAAKDAAAAETRRSIEADQADKAKKADDKRKLDEATARGEFETVRNQLTAERDNAVAEVAALRATLEQVIKEELEAIPGELRPDVRKMVPASLSLPDQLTALRAASKLLGKQQQSAPPGNGGISRPLTGEQRQQAAASQASIYRN